MVKFSNKQSGQVLLITVMLIATAITVVMTLIFKSTTETQVTKLQQESDQALVAAESALEVALRGPVVGAYSSLLSAGLDQFSGIDLENSSVSLSQPSRSYFISPEIVKDESYTFYLADYPNLATGNWQGILQIYFDSAAGTNCSGRDVPALELTLIYDNNQIKRWVAEPCTEAPYIENKNLESWDNGNGDFNGTHFQWVTQPLNLSSYTMPKVLIVRTFFSGTKLGFSGNINLRPQGNYLVSEAKSYSGVVKKIQLFQAYPQIPAEFFTASF